jgi:hypothetical protein
MDIASLAKQIEPETARAFVSAARHVIDAAMLEAERVNRAMTPPARDYASSTLDRSTPAGGWITPEELREAARQVGEAMADERWNEGIGAVLKSLALIWGLAAIS